MVNKKLKIVINFFNSIVKFFSGTKEESLVPDEILLKTKFHISCTYCDNEETTDMKSNSEVVLHNFLFLGWLNRKIGIYECNLCKRTNTKVYNE